MAYDQGQHRLYVADFESNSVQVINVSSGLIEHTLGGFSEPQGVLSVPMSGSVFVSNGGTGVVNVLSAGTLASLGNISLGSDADNLRFDQATNLVYVGYGSGGVAAINPTDYSVQWTGQLSGHPEGFQVDSMSSSIFVNVPTSGYGAVVSMTNHSVSARLPLANASGNFPMAIDAAHGLLFVGTRSPPQLLVLDSSTGRQVASLGIPQDPDDIFFNPATRCIYVSTGQGSVAIALESDPSHFSLIREVTTSPGARTSLLDPGSNLYFVASPASGTSTAMILVYRAS